MTHSYAPEYQIVMLGAGAVGKSMLTTRFINGGYSEDYDPTIEDSYRKLCTIDGADYVLDILDTAGQEEYVAMREQYMRSGNGFIIVYSITSRSSLTEAEVLASYVKRVKDSDVVPIVLVGNKSDLENSRRVQVADGHKVASRINAGFYETSAKENINVHEAFVQCVRRIRHFSKPPATKTSATHQSMDSSSDGARKSLSLKKQSGKPLPVPRKFSDTKASGVDRSWLPSRLTSRRGKNGTNDSREGGRMNGDSPPSKMLSAVGSQNDSKKIIPSSPSLNRHGKNHGTGPRKKYNKEDIRIVGAGTIVGAGNLGSKGVISASGTARASPAEHSNGGEKFNVQNAESALPRGTLSGTRNKRYFESRMEGNNTPFADGNTLSTPSNASYPTKKKAKAGGLGSCLIL